MTFQEQKIKELNNSKIMERISSSEMFAINHGYPQWEGENLIDWISSALQEQKEMIVKAIKEEKESKIPWQALKFSGGCPHCGADVNQDYIDDVCKEIKNECLDDLEDFIIKQI